MGQKSSKGSVSITNCNGRIRLRWRYQGIRYSLSLFSYNKANLTLARKSVLQLELDIINNQFDETLIRYGKSTTESVQAEPVIQSSIKPDLVKCFELWTREYRQIDCERKSHYRHTRNILKRWADVPLDQLVFALNKEKFCAQTFNERLSILRGFSQWMVKQKTWASNPFEDVSKRKKDKSIKPERKPFSIDEIFSILEAVRTDRFCPHSSRFKHSYYYPFLYFIFKTGVRNAEAIGLRVKHIDFQNAVIHIKETMARTVKGTNAAARVRKQTKNGKERILPLTQDLRDVIAPMVYNKLEDDLVFPSYTGGPIDDRMFQRRIFSIVLKHLDIPHRVLYACRHIFGSRCIESGITPVMTAFLMGNNPETALRNYTHQLGLPTQLPDVNPTQ